MQKNRLRCAKNVIFSLLCILIDRPMGGFEPPKLPPAYALDLQKKKVFAEIVTVFSAKIENSNAFLAQKQLVISKKRSSPKLNAFSGRITTPTSQLRHPISFGGAVFIFFIQNWPLKHKKRAILHTLQTNRGSSSPPPPPPPGYATSGA